MVPPKPLVEGSDSLLTPGCVVRVGVRKDILRSNCYDSMKTSLSYTHQIVNLHM